MVDFGTVETTGNVLVRQVGPGDWLKPGLDSAQHPGSGRSLRGVNEDLERVGRLSFQTMDPSGKEIVELDPI